MTVSIRFQLNNKLSIQCCLVRVAICITFFFDLISKLFPSPKKSVEYCHFFIFLYYKWVFRLFTNIRNAQFRYSRSPSWRIEFKIDIYYIRKIWKPYFCYVYFMWHNSIFMNIRKPPVCYYLYVIHFIKFFLKFKLEIELELNKSVHKQ